MRRLNTQPEILYRYPFLLYTVKCRKVRHWTGEICHVDYTMRHSLMSMYINMCFLSADLALEMDVIYFGAEHVHCILPYTTVQKRRDMFHVAFNAVVHDTQKKLIDHCEFTVEILQEYVARTTPNAYVTRSILNNKICQLNIESRTVRY